MNKHQLIDAIVASTDLTKSTANQALDAVLHCITNALVAGETVSLVGFGSFGTKVRAARSGRNPKTGEVIQISAATVPYFKAGKLLKEAVSSTEEEVVEV